MGSERAGSQPPLLPAAKRHRLQQRPRDTSDVERADAFRPVDLVCIERQEINRQGPHVYRYLAGRLRSISMESDAPITAQRTDGANILNNADLVVHIHERHEHSVRPKRSAYHLWFDTPLAIRR